MSEAISFMKLAELSDLDRDTFVAAIGAVYENSPWVAERAWGKRPFASLDRLCAVMNSEVLSAMHDEQLSLLRAHPDLGTRARIGEASAREQAGAGLDRLTLEEHALLLQLNTEYQEKFGFPFLYAVKGSNKHQILSALERRLASTPEEEFAEALKQVFRIARYRLEDIIQ
jgi:2-oxo-4-hydroxy-4-carboxy-5-ureidoimidazoline decarboxylase